MITAIDPVAQKYLPYWASPTSAGVGQYHSNNFFAAGSQPETDQRFDVRLDDNITQAQHLFGRISIHRENGTSPNFFHNDFYAATTSFDHDGNLLIGYDWMVSSSTVLQLRGSATRHYEDSGGVMPGGRRRRGMRIGHAPVCSLQVRSDELRFQHNAQQSPGKA